MKKVAVILVNDMHMDLENANKLLNHIYANYNYEVVCDYTIADIIIIMTCAGQDLGNGDATHRLVITATRI